MVLARVDVACSPVGEPPVPDAPRRAGVLAHVADECDTQRSLPQGFTQLVDDLRRSVGEPVEDPQHPRADVVGVGVSRRRLMPGKAEEVIALVTR